MAQRPEQPPVALVGPISIGISPPRPLGEPGRALWNSIQSEYHIDDVGGLELLAQCCAAQDRVEALRAAIDRDGEVVHTPSGPKSHPALRDELATRAFICKALERLGLTLETVKPLGRPPRSLGWRGNDAD